MPGTYKQTHRALSLTTPLGPDTLLLHELHGREAISELFCFQLSLIAENSEDISFDKLLGQKVTIAIQIVLKDKPRYISGIVSRISQSGRDNTFTSYRMEVVPQFWLLTRKRQSRIFQALSIPDILKKVLAGMDVAYELRGQYDQRDYCVQYRESDFAFASRLMEEEGIYYFFKHTNGGHKLVLADTPTSHADLDPSKIIYDEIEGGNREEERVHLWERSQELRSGKTTLWDHCFELPHKHLDADKTIVDSIQVGTVTHKQKVANNDKLELYDWPGDYASRFDGVDRGGGDRAADIQKIFQDNKRTVEIRMQAEATQGITIRGASTCAFFTPAYAFSLDRHFNANGRYVLTSLEHSASLVGDYRSGNVTGSAYGNSFTCIPAALPYRPPRVTAIPQVIGTQTAVVVGPAGEEIFTDKYGRIKVQFHWDREGKNDGNSSCWVRASTPWAGKNWGMIHIPRIGQEVVIDFINGNPNDPICIGSVYNAEMMPPYTLPDNKTQSGILTRSTLSGNPETCNEICFEDKKGSELLYIRAEKDQKVSVENDETYWVGHDRWTEVENDETVTITNNRKEIIEKGNETIIIKTGNREETIEKGNEKLTIKMGNREETIEMGNEKLTIKMGNRTEKLDLGKSDTEAMQSIEFKVGQSSIKLDQTGVTIKGMMIKIEGTITVDVKGLMTTVKADAILTAKGSLTMIN